MLDLVHTKKPPVLYQTPPRQIPKNPPFCTKHPPKCATPRLYQETPPHPPPPQNQYATKPPFLPKNHLASPHMLHLWTLVYQKDNLVAPFRTKKP